MATFPNSPGAEALARLTPAFQIVPSGTRLARIYYADGPHPVEWNGLRYRGPVNARWDHHMASAGDEGEAGATQLKVRGICYAAGNAKTCLAEAFENTRRIDRAFQSPWLTVFETVSPLQVLDLTGEFATRMGASVAIHSGGKARSRGWARDLYAAFEDSQGIQYASSMHGGAPAFALYERALSAPLFAPHPLFNRALADDVMLHPLKHAAQALGFALR